MAKDLAVVLNDGNLNAAVATSLAAQKFRPVLVMIETGAVNDKQARSAFDQQVAHFKPFREHVVPMPIWSALTKPDEPAVDPRRTRPFGPVLTALMPMLGVGVRLAAHYNAAAIYVGLRLGTAGDGLAAATEFGQILDELFAGPLGLAETKTDMPLLELEPWQVVDLGVQVAAPFERTWTCSEAGTEPCWACRACRAREAAFQQAARPDPLRVVRKV